MRLFLLTFFLLVGGVANVFATPPAAIEGPQRRVVPRSVSLRLVKERGLLAKVWINNSGPFTFAVDTGAGITLVSTRVADDVNLPRNRGQVYLGGLSGRSSRAGTNTILNSMALGDSSNSVNSNQKAIIVDDLPRDLDGVLDPTSAFLPLGYSIDLPHRILSAFDARLQPLQLGNPPQGGTVVRWLNQGDARRPFVRLDDGRIALLDTGSGFGLAVSRGTDMLPNGGSSPVVNDIGGGHVSVQRTSPSTISIGELVLRKIPTDLISGSENDAPILIGRDALYPFRLTFDPVNKLIEIAPAPR